MDSSFKTWLYRIVINLCYDRLRRRARERAAFQRVSVNMKTGYRDMSDIEKRIDLKEVIATLNPDYRITLTLYYGMDLSVQKLQRYWAFQWALEIQIEFRTQLA